MDDEIKRNIYKIKSDFIDIKTKMIKYQSIPDEIILVGIDILLGILISKSNNYEIIDLYNKVHYDINTLRRKIEDKQNE